MLGVVSRESGFSACNWFCKDVSIPIDSSLLPKNCSCASGKHRRSENRVNQQAMQLPMAINRNWILLPTKRSMNSFAHYDGRELMRLPSFLFRIGCGRCLRILLGNEMPVEKLLDNINKLHFNCEKNSLILVFTNRTDHKSRLPSTLVLAEAPCLPIW